ncbi:hypothetical protein [Maridesulfovibrio bastinii]|uniref:hypothetical protein n=1 Tax=Maridesulfovibrio bastinii TaxID=47157 RepID=UPI000413A070|nr:hypothetical protein [Maridesulfovibrio bastinii]
MIEDRVETLAALYPMENRRLLRNYVSFLDDYPDWHSNGRSLDDYKRRSFLSELSFEVVSKSKPRQKEA